MSMLIKSYFIACQVVPLLDLGQALRASEPNYREEAAHFPLLLAGLMLGASFMFGDGIILPATRRSRPKPTASITQ